MLTITCELHHKEGSDPLPRIDETLDALSDARYLTTLDPQSGYWQVQVREEDKEKTAFVTHHGHWEFNALPLGFGSGIKWTTLNPLFGVLG